MSGKKIASIAYVEDTKKHHGLIADAATKGTKKAVRRSRKAKVSITYVKGMYIIKESPAGKKRVLGKVGLGRKVEIGSTERIS